MHLEDCKALDKGIDSVSGNLFTFIEDDVHTLKECNKVLVLDKESKRPLIHALDDCIKCWDKVFFINIESLSCSNLDDLESTEQTCQNIWDAIGVGTSLAVADFDFEVFSHYWNQIPNNFQVDILGKLW